MTETPRWKRRLRAALVACVVLLLGSAPWWGRAGLRRLEFFRVRRVEIDGTRYVSPDQIVSRLRVDSTASVFDDMELFEKRVRLHPSVREVRITRRLPGTLVVRITENLPVALVPAVLTAPLLHANLEHIVGNSVTGAIFAFLIGYSGKRVFWEVTTFATVFSGLGTWLFGGIGTNHLGASGVIYGWLIYLLVRGSVHAHAYALALKQITGVDLDKRSEEHTSELQSH